MSNSPTTHDPDKLLVEMDARLKVRDIREWEKLKREVEPKWWESGLLALLFISGIGILATLWKILPSDNRLLYEFILGWFVLFVLTMMACVEFLLLKFRALRRMHHLTCRQVEGLEQSLKAIRNYLEARENAEREE